MTDQETKKMDELQQRRQQLAGLLCSTKVNTGQVMTFEEHREYEALYAALTAVVEQMNAIAEASCVRTIEGLRLKKAMRLQQA